MGNKDFKPKRKKRRGAARSRTIFILVFILLALVVSSVVSCSMKNAKAKKSVQVTVNLIDDKGNIILNYPVTVTAPKPTASMAFEKLFNEKLISYNLENGMFTQINNLAITDTHAWMFYVNGASANVGAQAYEICEGDTIEFRYENFSGFLNPSPTPEAVPEDDGEDTPEVAPEDDGEVADSSDENNSNENSGNE